MACGEGGSSNEADVDGPPDDAAQPEEVSDEPDIPSDPHDPSDPEGEPDWPELPPSPPDTEVVEDLTCPVEGPLENEVRASEWVRDRLAPEASRLRYAYRADVVGEGFAEVRILDSPTGFGTRTMTVRQLLGEEEQDGALLAEYEWMTRRYTLLTRGEELSPQGYTQRAWLENHQTGSLIEMEARFETVRCWSAEDLESGPPCAGALPLLDPNVQWTGCGLISDERIHAGAPAELVELAWIVEAPEDGPLGDSLRRGEQTFSRLEVFGNGQVVDGQEREAWLEAHGASWMEVDVVREFLLMWSDQAWWRTLEHHIAFCEVTLLEEPHVLIPKSRCPGDHQSDRWGAPTTGRTAGVFGDPNLVTLDGHVWGFHATGEYVLVESTEGTPFALHGRFEPVLDVPVPACLGVSLSTGLATEINGHRVTVLQGPPFEVWVDEQRLTSADDVPVLDDGYAISLRRNAVELRWAGGEVVTATAGPELLTITVSLPPERRRSVRGLLGTFDGRPATDHVLPHGEVLPQPLSFDAMYAQLGPAWRLDADSTLFRHVDGEGPDDFYRPGFPEASVRVAHLPEDRVESAAEVCDAAGITDAHLRNACILDVVCMDDPDVAASTAMAPLPVTSQPPGFHDLVVVGDVRQIEPPLLLDLDEEPSPDTCGPWRPETLSIFEEQAEWELDAPLEVHLSGPGTLRLDEGEPQVLEPGTRIQSWSLSRRMPVNPARVHNAEIRFAQPIVGVQVESEDLVAADAFLGALATTYPPEGVAGVAASEDRLRLEADQRTLRVTWTGEQAHRLRILVEAP